MRVIIFISIYFVWGGGSTSDFPTDIQKINFIVTIVHAVFPKMSLPVLQKVLI